MPTRFRKRPVEVDAIQWTGDNLPAVQEFAPSKLWPVDPEDRIEDPDITAQVYDELHSTWVGVKTGQWIIRGVKGEYYPIATDVLADTYEPVEEDDRG
jgi:hypothetical protein